MGVVCCLEIFVRVRVHRSVPENLAADLMCRHRLEAPSLQLMALYGRVHREGLPVAVSVFSGRSGAPLRWRAGEPAGVLGEGSRCALWTFSLQHEGNEQRWQDACASLKAWAASLDLSVHEPTGPARAVDTAPPVTDVLPSGTAEATTCASIFPSPLFGFSSRSAMSPNGALLAVADQKSLQLFNAHNGALLRALPSQGVVSSVRFVGGGTHLLSATQDGLVRRWDVQSGAELWSAQSLESILALSPDGSLALMWADHSVERLQIWNIATSALLHTLKVEIDFGYAGAEFSGDGKRLALGGRGGRVMVWDVQSGALRWSAQEDPAPLVRHKLSSRFEDIDRGFNLLASPARSLAFSADGRWLLSSVATRVVIWDVDRGTAHHRLDGHQEEVQCAAFSADGSLIVAGADDGAIKMWRRENGRRVWSFYVRNECYVRSVQFTPDGAAVVSQDVEAIRWWSTEHGGFLHSIGSVPGALSAVRPSPDGVHLVSGGRDGAVRLWDIEQGRCVQVFRGHTKAVSDVGFSGSAGWAVSGSGDLSVRIWGAKSGELVKVLGGRGGWLQRLVSMGHGSILRRLIDGDPKNVIVVRSPASADRASVRRLKWMYKPLTSALKWHVRGVCSTAISDDGRYALSADWSGFVRLWGLPSGSLLQIWDCGSPSERVAFSRRGGLVMAASGEAVWAWDMNSGAQVHRADARREMLDAATAFSPDGAYALCTSGTGAYLVSLQENKVVRRFEGHQANVSCTALSPDGRRALTGDRDHTIRLWDVKTGNLMCAMRVSDTTITSVGFAADGRRLISSSSDDFIQVWDIAARQCRIMWVDASDPGFPELSWSGTWGVVRNAAPDPTFVCTELIPGSLSVAVAAARDTSSTVLPDNFPPPRRVFQDAAQGSQGGRKRWSWEELLTQFGDHQAQQLAKQLPASWRAAQP